MLHGTGGNESDLIPLGEKLLPGAGILSPRGRISEGGMPRFFRRFAEGVFDVESIKVEAVALSDFLVEASREHQFDSGQVFAVGFSNGANMAHSLICLHPDSLMGVIAIRAMTTMPDLNAIDLKDKRIIISTGKTDPIVPNDDARHLEVQLRSGGAVVTHHWVDAGHNLTREEIPLMATWLG